MPPASSRSRHGIAGSPFGRREIPARRLQSLLEDLGPSLQRGADLAQSSPNESIKNLRPCGLTSVDTLLGGGFPSGQLVEITGPPSSGRTSVALSLLAQTTGEESELAAWVDLADAFDPVSAQSLGAHLDLILWVRAQDIPEALRSLERLVDADGIPLVFFDSSGLPGTIPDSVWNRLSRVSRARDTTLILLSERRLTCAQAEVVLEMQEARPSFQGTPPLLEKMALQAIVKRKRGSPTPEAEMTPSPVAANPPKRAFGD